MPVLPLSPKSLALPAYCCGWQLSFSNLTGRLNSAGAFYLVMNAVGASLACLSSWLIDFMPFVLLEGTWAAVAIVSLLLMMPAGRRGS